MIFDNMRFLVYLSNCLHWQISKRMQTNDNTLHTYPTEVGIITCNDLTGIVSLDITADINLDKLFDTWCEMINKGWVNKKHSKFIFIQNEFLPLDNSSRILKSYQDWYEFFPNAYLAMVTTNPKVSALTTMMSKADKKVKLFERLEDATAWLSTVEGNAQTEEPTSSEAHKISYDSEKDIIYIDTLRDIYASEISATWEKYLNQGLFKPDSRKFILNLGKYTILGKASEALGRTGYWTAHFPDAYLAILAQDPRAIAVVGVTNSRNPNTALVKNHVEAVSWVSQADNKKPSAVHYAGFGLYGEDEFISLHYSTNRHIAIIDLHQDLSQKDINNSMMNFVNKYDDLQSMRMAVMNYGTFNITDTREELLEYTDPWDELFPGNYKALVTTNPELIALISNDQILHQYNEHSKNNKIFANINEALTWLNSTNMPMACGDISYDEQNDIVTLQIQHDFTLQCLVQTCANALLNGLIPKDAKKLLLVQGEYHLNERLTELFNNTFLWKELFPNARLAVVVRDEVAYGKVSLCDHSKQYIHPFYNIEEAQRWLNTGKTAASSNEFGALYLDKENSIAIIDTLQNVTLAKLNSMWKDFVDSKQLPLHYQRFILNLNNYQVVDEDAMTYHSSWNEYFPKAHMAVVTSNKFAELLNPQAFDSFQGRVQGFNAPLDAYNWLFEKAPKEDDDIVTAEYDAQNKIAIAQITKDYYIAEHEAMWAKYLRLKLFPLDTQKFIFDDDGFKLRDNGAQLLRYSGEWMRMFSDRYLALVLSDPKFIAYASMLAKKNPRIGIVQNRQEALEWVNQADKTSGAKVPNIYGTLRIDEEHQVAIVDALQDITLDGLNIMWESFVNDNHLPLHIQRFILNCGDFKTIDENVVKLESSWSRLFPKGHMAIVNNNEKDARYNQQVELPFNGIAKVVNSIDEAYSWLFHVAPLHDGDVAIVKYTEETKTAHVKIIRDYQIDEINGVWEKFVNNKTIPEGTRKFIYEDCGFKAVSNGSQVLQFKGTWKRTFPNSYLAFIATDTKLCAYVNILCNRNNRICLATDRTAAQEWVDKADKELESAPSKVNFEPIINKPKSKLGVLTIDKNNHIAMVEIQRDVKIDELYDMWRNFVAEGKLDSVTRRFILAQGDHKLLSPEQEVIASESTWAEMFPGAKLGIVTNDAKSINTATLMNHDDRNIRPFANVNDAKTWLTAAVDEYIEPLAKASYDPATKIAVVEINQHIRLSELNERWKEFFERGIIAPDAKGIICNQGRFSVLDDSHSIKEFQSVWMKYFPNARLAIITSDPKTVAILSGGFKNPYMQLKKDPLHAYQWFEEVELEAKNGKPLKTAPESAVAKLTYDKEKDIAVVEILEDVKISKLNRFWKEQVNKGTLPRHAHRFVHDQKDFCVIDETADALVRFPMFQQLFPKAFMAVVASDPKTQALANMAAQSNPRIKLMKNINDAWQWLENPKQ